MSEFRRTTDTVALLTYSLSGLGVAIPAEEMMAREVERHQFRPDLPIANAANGERNGKCNESNTAIANVLYVI